MKAANAHLSSRTGRLTYGAQRAARGARAQGSQLRERIDVGARGFRPANRDAVLAHQLDVFGADVVAYPAWLQQREASVLVNTLGTMTA